MSAYVDTKLDTLLARFFSETTVRSLLQQRCFTAPVLNEFLYLVKELKFPFTGNTYNDLFHFAFTYLSKNYRNEYVYKNAIAKNILLGKHSLNTSFMLQEVRVGSCKADTVVLNGTANVYEIKTELDSLDRLQHQIQTYLQVFDMVHVITFPGHSQKIQNFVPESVGLMELTKRNNISTIREAKSGKHEVSPAVLFDTLRKSEYQEIVREYYGEAPDVPNTQSYKVYKDLFIRINPARAHDLAVEQLKKRGNCVRLKNFIRDAPDYFKSLALNSSFSDQELEALKKLLSSELRINQSR